MKTDDDDDDEKEEEENFYNKINLFSFCLHLKKIKDRFKINQDFKFNEQICAKVFIPITYNRCFQTA